MPGLRRYADAFPQVPAWAYLLFLAAAVGWPFLVPNFWVFLGAAACIFAIGVLGLTVLVGWAGQVSLAQGALIGTAVYVSGYAARNDGWGWPLLPAIAVGTVAAVALSCLVALPTARLSGIYVMVLTLGLQVTIERTIFSNPTLTGGAQGVFLGRPRLFGVSVDTDRGYYLLTLAVLLAVMTGLALFRASRHGRAMLLVKTDRRAAAAVGISPWRYKVIAFALAGVLAGISGGLTAPLYLSPPNFSAYIALASLLYLAVTVTAGFESLLSVVAVAFLVQMVPQALERFHISMFVIGGVGLLAGTYVGPRGLGGSILGLLENRALRRRDLVDLTATAGAIPALAALATTNGRGRPVVHLAASGTGTGPIRLGPRHRPAATTGAAGRRRAVEYARPRRAVRFPTPRPPVAGA